MRKKGSSWKNLFFYRKKYRLLKNFYKKISFFREWLFLQSFFSWNSKDLFGQKSSTNKMAKSFIGRFVGKFCSWWIMMIISAHNDESWWILMNYDESWWLLARTMENIDEYWWIMMNLDESWWLLAREMKNIDES